MDEPEKQEKRRSERGNRGNVKDRGPDERSKSPQVRTKLDKDRERDRDSAKDREREREKEKEREKEEKKEEKREKEKERRALSRHPSAPSSQPPTLLLSSSAPAMAPSLSSLPPVSARTREEEQRKADRSKASAANGMTGRNIQKPTNARHLVHVAKDPETGGLVLIRGDEVVKITDEEQLASYGDLLKLNLSAFDDIERGTTSPPLSPVAQSGSSLLFPPRNAILLRGLIDDSDDYDGAKESEIGRESDDMSAESSESSSGKHVKASANASNPIDPLRPPRNLSVSFPNIAPDLGKFASPYIQRVPVDLSESDTADSTVEEERKSRMQIRSERRDKLIQEFVRSEANHVEALKSVIVDYLAPLRESKMLLPQQQKNLFCNIELILMWNMDFLQMLKDRLVLNVPEGEVCFGDIIIKTSVILRQLFAQYNQNYPLAQLTYQELLKNKEFEQFIQNKSALSTSRSNLLTALYLPIQRMIIYDSLLKEVLNLTPPTHKDYDNLTTAYKLLRSMDKAANRVAEKRKNMDTVLRIQNSLTGNWDIAQPHRSYVFEENVMLVVGKSLKERTLYLFNDILLLAKFKRKNKYDVERSIALDKIAVDSYDNDRHLFKIAAAGEEFWFHSENKTSWLQLLHSTIKKLHAPPSEIDDLLQEEHEHADTQKTSGFERDLLKNGAVPVSKNLLKKKIVKWSTMKDTEQIMKEIKRTARLIVQYEAIRTTHGVHMDDSEDSTSLHLKF